MLETTRLAPRRVLLVRKQANAVVTPQMDLYRHPGNKKVRTASPDSSSISFAMLRRDLAAAGSEAIPAQDRTVVARFEGDLRLRSALCAYSIVHFTGARRRSAIPAAFPYIPAILATDRLILEAFFRIELLFAGSEYEILATVLALECSVLERH
jgi:hypothetical protein